MKNLGYIPKMLDKSRYYRRLHKTGRLLFIQVGSYLKSIRSELHYQWNSLDYIIPNCPRIKTKKDFCLWWFSKQT
jgi:hypothetical protein